MSLLLENMKNEAAEKPFIQHRGIAAAKENGGLCISRVKLLGRSCKGIMQIPDWVSRADCQSRACTLCLYLGSDYANHTPQPGPGQLAEWEKLGFCIRDCSVLSTQPSPQAVQSKHNHPALPAPRPGLPTDPHWITVRVHFHSLWVSHQKNKKWKLRWKLLHVACSSVMPGKFCLSKEGCTSTGVGSGLSFALCMGMIRRDVRCN